MPEKEPDCKNQEDQVHQAVRSRYAAYASGETPQPDGSILDAEGRTGAKIIGYSQEDLADVPAGADMGLSCGTPLAYLHLQTGETILDLGSGAGMDCFIASKLVSPGGRVIGIDMTPEMVERARENALQGNYLNVEFRQGEIENLPVDDESVDVVISNCVMNLLVNKARGFSEAWRVLKPGGRLSVSDIVTIGDVPKRLARSVQAYTACLSGAVPKEEYISLLRGEGFEDIQVIKEKTWPFFRGYASLHLKAARPLGRPDLRENT